MKKWIVSLLTFALVAGMLVGCGTENSSSVSDGVTEIVIWHDKEDEVAEILQRKLEMLEPEIHVTLEKKERFNRELKNGRQQSDCGS